MRLARLHDLGPSRIGGILAMSLCLAGWSPVGAPTSDSRSADGLASNPSADAVAGKAPGWQASAPPLALGETVPDIQLTDQDGSSLSLGELAGTVVVMTFFESRSPDPALCPTLMKRLAHVQEILRPDLWERVHLLAVSVDPAHDTAAVLHRQGESLEADFDHWSLVTTEKAAVTELAAAFGVFLWERADGSVGHTLNTVIISPQGRLADRFPGSTQWSADDLLASVVLLAER
ncbi:MAG: SCO family protein [Acidobacteriota bacterium]